MKYQNTKEMFKEFYRFQPQTEDVQAEQELVKLAVLLEKEK